MKELLTLLRPYLKYLDPTAHIGMDDELTALGLDSMAVIDLLLAIEEHYNIIIPDDKLVDETFETPRTLWRVVMELTIGGRTL